MLVMEKKLVQSTLEFKLQEQPLQVRVNQKPRSRDLIQLFIACSTKSDKELDESLGLWLANQVLNVSRLQSKYYTWVSALEMMI